MKITEIKVPPEAFSLMEKRADQLVSLLASTVELCGTEGSSPDKPEAVLLIQEGATYDKTRSWLDEISRSLLFDELFARLWRLRQILSKIEKSRVPWIYIANDSCLGTYFELASACRFRLWAKQGAKVGFPDIAGGSFPCCGIFERLVLAAPSLWLSQPILTSRSALEQGLVNFSGDIANCREVFTSWICQSKVLPILTNSASSSPPPGLQMMKNPSPTESVSLSINQLSDSVDKSLNRSARAFDYCMSLLKSRPRRGNEPEITPAIVNCSTRFLLSNHYLAWAERDVLHGESASYHSRGDTALSVVYIDLDHPAPPVGPIVRLLVAHRPIIFFSHDAAQLRLSLEIIYGRLDRQLGTKAAANLWRKYVAWFQGEPGKESLQINWTIDDKQIIVGHHQQLELFRLNGNRGRSPAGITEVIAADDPSAVDQELLTLAQASSDRVVISSGVGSYHVPVSIFVRSVFLEELVQMVSNIQQSISQVLDTLKNYQWVDSGQEQFWEHFLRVRQNLVSVEGTRALISEFDFHFQTWELALWKEIKARLRNDRPPRETWTSETVCKHFALLAAYLAFWIHQKKLVSSAADADLLLIGSLGFPTYLGTPLYFLSKWPRLQLISYAQKNWPDLLAHSSFPVEC